MVCHSTETISIIIENSTTKSWFRQPKIKSPNKFYQRDLSKYKTDHPICVFKVFQWVSTTFSINSKCPWLSTSVPCLIWMLLTPPSSCTTLLHKCLPLVSCGIAGLPTYSAFAYAALSLPWMSTSLWLSLLSSNHWVLSPNVISSKPPFCVPSYIIRDSYYAPLNLHEQYSIIVLNTLNSDCFFSPTA